MTIFIISVFVIYILLKLSPYLIAFFEKEHLRHDVEPKPYDAAEWKSDYLIEQEGVAKNTGLTYCGSYFTTKGASVVRGYMLLYVTSDHLAIVSLVSARIEKTELKKVVVSSRFSDGTALTTSDGFQVPDCTKAIERQTFYRVGIPELLQSHAARLAEIGKRVDAVTPASAFRLYEDLEYQRGIRLVAMGLARWTDPAQTKARRTIKGVFATVKANNQEKNAVVQRESRKREQAAPAS